MTTARASGRNPLRTLKLTTLLGVAALVMVGYGLRQYGARSSINYIPDTQIIREALDVGQALAGGRTFDVNINGGLKYPLTLPYFLLGVYGLVFAGGFVTGNLPNLQAFTDFLFLQRETVHLLSVGALNLINVAVIPLAFVAARKLDKRHTGWLAAGLVTFDLILVQYSHQARPHAPLATFMLLAVMLLAYIAEGRGRWWATLGATVACVLAIGTLQTGMALCVPFGLVWLGRLLNAYKGKTLRAELRLLGVNVIVLVVLSLAVYPTLINELYGIGRSLVAGSGSYTLGGGAHTVQNRNFNLDTMARFIPRFFGYQPVPFVLLPIALVYFIWQFRKRPRLLLAVLPIPIGSLVVWSLYFAASRYWGDLSVFVDLLCAYFLEEVVRRAVERWQWPQAALLAGLGVVVIGSAAVQALRLDYVTAKPDTRTQASQWLENNLPDGSVVMANFNLLEVLPNVAGLKQQKKDYPGSLGTYGQWLLKQTPQTYPPGRAFEIVDYTLYWPDDAAQETEFVQRRHIQYVIAQASLTPLSLDMRLMDYGASYGQPVAIFCPGQRWEANYLPTDIFNIAWQAIWKVNHPGPIVVIFKLENQPHITPVPLACP